MAIPAILDEQVRKRLKPPPVPGAPGAEMPTAQPEFASPSVVATATPSPAAAPKPPTFAAPAPTNAGPIAPPPAGQATTPPAGVPPVPPPVAPPATLPTTQTIENPYDPGNPDDPFGPTSPYDNPGTPPPSTGGPTTPAPPAPSADWNAGDHRGSFERLMQGVAPSSASLIAHRAQLEAAGWRLEPPNAMGIVSKMRNMATGQVVRVGGHFDSAPSEGFPMTWEWVEQPGGGGGPDPAAPTAPTAPAGPSDFQQRIRALLLEQLARAGQPVDTNSAEITAPMDAARLEQGRGQEQIRKALAERMYAQGGLQSGELGQGVQQSLERGASSLGNLHGQLVMKAFETKRQELEGYMQMALAAGDAEQAREIQLYIANLEGQLRREGYGVQLGIAGQGFNQQGAGA